MGTKTIHSPRLLAPKLMVELAQDEQGILASQRLRYQIFAGEQHAYLPSTEQGLDIDHFDAYCHHLLIREIITDEVVGSTRILTAANAALAGGFYSETEFDLSGILPLNGNYMEIGRTCIHPAYRNGVGISILWSGLARFIELHKIDYLFGCASISLQDGGAQACSAMQTIREKYLSPTYFRVTPHHPLQYDTIPTQIDMPPLLKAYLKLGAWVGGEACIDKDFNVADVFILLDMNQLNRRYHQRFVQKCLHHPAQEQKTTRYLVAA